MAFAAVNVALAATIATYAVAAPDGGGAAAAAVEEGVSATVEQTTAFQARGLLEIAFTNGSDEMLSIRSLRLLDRRFAPVAPTPRDADLAPGPRRVMMPIEYGAPVCEREAAAGRGGEPGPVIEISPPGDARPAQVAVDDAGDRFLARLHDRECGQQRVRDAVEISFTGPFDDVGRATVRLSIRLDRRTGDDPVVVAAMRGTVVFTVAAPAPVLDLPGRDASGATVVEISASRCDAHALIESKKSYRFPVWVAVGGGDPRYLEVEPRGEAREVLEQVLQEGCFASP